MSVSWDASDSDRIRGNRPTPITLLGRSFMADRPTQSIDLYTEELTRHMIMDFKKLFSRKVLLSAHLTNERNCSN